MFGISLQLQSVHYCVFLSFTSQKLVSESVVLFSDSLEQGKKYYPVFGLPAGVGALPPDPPCRAVRLCHLLGNPMSSVCLLPCFPALTGLVLKVGQDLSRKWFKVRHHPSVPTFLCSSYLGDPAWIWKPSWWLVVKTHALRAHPTLFPSKTMQAIWPLQSLPRAARLKDPNPLSPQYLLITSSAESAWPGVFTWSAQDVFWLRLTLVMPSQLGGAMVYRHWLRRRCFAEITQAEWYVATSEQAYEKFSALPILVCNYLAKLLLSRSSERFTSSLSVYVLSDFASLHLIFA